MKKNKLLSKEHPKERKMPRILLLLLLAIVGSGVASCTKQQGCMATGNSYGYFYFTGNFQYFDAPKSISFYSNSPDNTNDSTQTLLVDAILVLDSTQSTWLVEYYDTIGFKKSDIPVKWRKKDSRYVAAAVHPLHGYATNAFVLDCIEDINH